MRKSIGNLYPLFILSVFLLILINSCKKEDTNIDIQKPKVVTVEVSSISYTTATSGGTVSSEGGYVTKKGVCWSAKLNPTIADTKTNNDKGTGSFTSNLTGLEPGASYHIRAYASYLVVKAGKGSTEETVYGQDFAYTTNIIAAPTISTTSATNITATSASSGGVITSDGGSLVSTRGVCWSAGSNPTIMLSTKTNDGIGIGTFTSNINGLTAGTTYHVRAYATNTSGTGYGPDIAFVTTSVVPSIITASVSSVTTTTAICGGNVSSDGGSAVSVRGVIWGTSNNLTITMSTKTIDGNGTGTYTSFMTGLSVNTTYYVRAYATNDIGTAYGLIESFRTGNINPPTVTTSAVSNISQTTATSGGNVTSDGGVLVTSRGICWSTTINPTIALTTKTVDGSSTGSFASSLTGLKSEITYYVRAYATNNLATSYGNQVSFTTSGGGSDGTFDYDGRKYAYKTLGTQTWMIENLAFLPSVSPSLSGSDTSPYYYVYKYESNSVSAAKATKNYITYGVLYNWEAAKTACPSGWHLPTDAEWTTLTDYLTNNGYGYGGSGSDIGKSMASTSGWTVFSSAGTIGNDQGSNNRSGFAALPGGYRYNVGSFSSLGSGAFFWSSSEYESNAFYRELFYHIDDVIRNYYPRMFGFSVRCLKNN